MPPVAYILKKFHTTIYIKIKRRKFRADQLIGDEPVIENYRFFD